MKRSILALALALAVVPAAANAQGFAPVPNSTEYLQFISGSGVNGGFGVQVGPYTGRFTTQPGTPSFNLYCVDFDHWARSGDVSAANLAGDLSQTRLGSTGGNVAAYTQAAYLSTLFDSQSTSSWGAIHAALWTTIRGNLNPAGNSVGDALAAARDGFIAQSEAAIAGGWTAGDGWYVLTQVNDLDASNPRSGQEFLVRTVPEPSTLLLLATGFMAIFGLGYRRSGTLA